MKRPRLTDFERIPLPTEDFGLGGRAKPAPAHLEPPSNPLLDYLCSFSCPIHRVGLTSTNTAKPLAYIRVVVEAEESVCPETLVAPFSTGMIPDALTLHTWVSETAWYLGSATVSAKPVSSLDVYAQILPSAETKTRLDLEPVVDVVWKDPWESREFLALGALYGFVDFHFAPRVHEPYLKWNKSHKDWGKDRLVSNPWACRTHSAPVNLGQMLKLSLDGHLDLVEVGKGLPPEK